MVHQTYPSLPDRYTAAIRSTHGVDSMCSLGSFVPETNQSTKRAPIIMVQWKKHMGVSKNRGTPKSSIFLGFSIINHPFWGTSIFGNSHIPQKTSRKSSSWRFGPISSTLYHAFFSG